MAKDKKSSGAESGIPDVCMVLEGTYPYVAGGVSSWVHALVQGLPHLTFTLMFIGATRSTRGEPKYETPPNVLGIKEFYLQDQGGSVLDLGGKKQSLSSDMVEKLETLHDDLKLHHKSPLLEGLAKALRTGKDSPSVNTLIRSPQSWDLLRRLYDRYGNDASFIDYYWTFVYTHLPVFGLLSVPPPPARVYHSVSTGYAGYYAALAKLQTGRPMVVTEHGIYTHERELEIAQATWIYSKDHDALAISQTRSFFKEWWINLFKFFSFATYGMADQVITITGVNQGFQLQDGADPKKMRIIPNGIDIKKFSALRRPEGQREGPFTVGFIGRVVPIKDVKTLVRAVKVCLQSIPDLKVYIVGPFEEDMEYYEECIQLADTLGVRDALEFTGRADVTKYYPIMDLVVLTSASEAVPLVILEAHCAGIPVVATDVGACREMLNGRTAADQALGPSGIVTPVASPDATGRAIVQIAKDPELRAAMGRAGMERVELFFRLEDLNREYDELYKQLTSREAEA